METHLKYGYCEANAARVPTLWISFLMPSSTGVRRAESVPGSAGYAQPALYFSGILVYEHLARGVEWMRDNTPCVKETC